MTIHELAERFGVSPRTIHDWVADHGMPPPHGRGPAARYGAEHVEWITAWQALRHHFVSGKAAAAHCRENGITLSQYLAQREASVKLFGIGAA